MSRRLTMIAALGFALWFWARVSGAEGKMHMPASRVPHPAGAERMRRYNVVWTRPSKDATGVMPLGNGDIGAGVYAIGDGDLYLLLSKNDAFNRPIS